MNKVFKDLLGTPIHQKDLIVFAGTVGHSTQMKIGIVLEEDVTHRHQQYGYSHDDRVRIMTVSSRNGRPSLANKYGDALAINILVVDTGITDEMRKMLYDAYDTYWQKKSMNVDN